MKKCFTLLFFAALFFVSNNMNSQSVCCPDFFLSDAVEICPAEGLCIADPVGGSGQFATMMAACRNSAHTYTVFPNESGFTFEWTVTGGTASSSTGNPNTILWGNGSTGTIKVVITNLDTTCVDSIVQDICLIDGPNANFTVSPNPVCQNTAVYFTNASIGGSAYLWDFGDGTTSTLPNPPAHFYGAPGTYNVLLTVTDMGAGYDTLLIIDQHEIFETIPCGCTDTISMTVVVLPGEGPVIDTDCCYGTVCPGEISSFCTPMICSSYNWTITGGSIVSGAGSSCIDVQWDASYTGPTTVSLQNCSTATCIGVTTMDVPVLYPNLPISGPTTLCVGASGTFSLPVLPGTYYDWTVSGGTYDFNKVDRNSEIVNISFLNASTFTVICQYNNPLAGCSGADTIIVNVLPEFSIFGPDVICEGGSSAYYASGLANWTISPVGATLISGNGTAVANISWTPGSYIVTATAINTALYCNSVATQIVNVTAKPVLNSILGDISICPDENYTYSVSSDVSGSDFVWSITNGSGSIQSEMGADKDSVIIKWTGSGPWEISVYQEIEIAPFIFCPSLVETLTITLFPAPLINVGDPSVCVDESATYSVSGATPPGGYNWTISPAGQGSIVSGQGTSAVNILWHGPSALAVVTVTSCSGSDTYNVAVNGPPNADVTYNATPVFCLGDVFTLTLSTPFIVGYTYQWYYNGSLLGGAVSSTLNINIGSIPTAGTYLYHVVVSINGCPVTSNIVHLIIEDCTIIGGGGGSGFPCEVQAYFVPYVVCDTITLVDMSVATPPATIIGYNWSVTGPGIGVFTPGSTSPSPTLNVSASGAYIITLITSSSTGCTDTISKTVNVLLPSANFSYTSPVCVGESTTFTPTPLNPLYNYAWDFGDFTTSYTGITQHIYGVASPPPYLVTLLITDEKGCTSSRGLPLNVNPAPNCTITAADTAFCPGGSVLLYTCSGQVSYQWYLDGNALSGETNYNINASLHGLYSVEITNSFLCTNYSDSVYIYMYPLPVADIEGEGYHCGFPGATVSFYLTTPLDANYSYSWSSNPSGATFTPSGTNNPFVSVTLPGSLPVTYQFIVDVTDVNTLCMSSDTICVTFYETPPLSIVSVPALNQCEGTLVTLSPTPNNTTLYSYSWNGGKTTPAITTSSAGFYSLTITDKATGCSNSQPAGLIFPLPDMDLFPLGCDTICDSDTLHLYMPLPLQPVAEWPFGTYPDAYPFIAWYANGNYGSPVGYGQDLYFSASTSGYDEISIVVQNRYGCTDTTGVFCLNTNTEVSFDVSTEIPCGCDTSIVIELVNQSSLAVLESFTVNTCDTFFTVCIDSLATYDLVGSNGVTIAGAISGAVVYYPGSTAPFIMGDEGLCCFAASDTNYIHILDSVTYVNDMVWSNKYYVADNVIVTVDNGSVLDITNVDVVFGECAGIVVKNGSYLRVNNSVLRPCEVDGSWRGVYFDGPGKFDNIINETTFKNAEVALYFVNSADAVVSSGLFSNCNYGIRIDGNAAFNHPISGNRFVTDDFFPDFRCETRYSFVSNLSTYGIYAMSSILENQVSHNDFINSKDTEFPRTYGIYQTMGGIRISENTFTDMFNSIWLQSPFAYCAIENNEIEVNVAPIFIFPSVYVLSSSGPIIEINHNEITNNYNKHLNHSAIYAVSTSNMSIVGNEIYGFYYGIVASASTNHQITENIINDAHLAGIFFYESANSSSYITCNQIKMKTFNSTYGMLAYNMSEQSEVSSNCVTDCATSLYFYGWPLSTGASPLLPKIRNNYLYNYTLAGIGVTGYNGNIGTVTDPGQNTLHSNYNSAVDINSSASITVADNYGMYNISFPQVQIVSNNPYHSTASCGHQIFNMPSQGNLNVNYSCDNFLHIADPLIGAAGTFKLSETYQIDNTPQENQLAEILKVVGTLDNSDQSEIESLLDESGLTESDRDLVQYIFHRKHAGYEKAYQHLNLFNPDNQQEEDYKYLMLLELRMLLHGNPLIPDEETGILETMIDRESEYSNVAITLLNQKDYRDHTVWEPFNGPDISGNNSKIQDTENNYLNIYPVPATDQVFIEYINASSGSSLLQVFDASGRLVTEYSSEIIADGFSVNIKRLTEGFYYVALSDPDAGIILNGKFMKLKDQ